VARTSSARKIRETDFSGDAPNHRSVSCDDLISGIERVFKGEKGPLVLSLPYQNLKIARIAGNEKRTGFPSDPFSLVFSLS
jgi:hypothetical protein